MSADNSEYDIFISYRRDCGSALAHNVYKELKARGYRAFLDVEEMRAGPFPSTLRQTIRHTKDFVILLTAGTLDRCCDEGDWLRTEICHALSSDCNIVPLRTKDFRDCTAPDLPPAVRDVQKQHSVVYEPNYDAASFDKLCSLLKSRPAADHSARRGIVRPNGGDVPLQRRDGNWPISTLAKRLLGISIVLLSLFFSADWSV